MGYSLWSRVGGPQCGRWSTGSTQLASGNIAQRFAENYIDAGVLRDLTDQTWRKSASRSETVRSCCAPSRACRASRCRAAPAAQLQPPRRRGASPAHGHVLRSRRLHGAVDAARSRGPARGIGAYHRCVAETVGRFGGFVAKYMGDGVLVYFGYPQAHEHDAERAVRAGLALVEAVAELRLAPNVTLQVRVGIATGLVVVGDLVGEDAAQERGSRRRDAQSRRAAAGDCRAGRGGDRSRPRAASSAVCSNTAISVRWRSKVSPSRAGMAGARARARSESRFEALHATGVTPLVGREEEIELLLRRWQQAKSGEGGSCCSRARRASASRGIAGALSGAAPGEPHIRLRYFCSPHHQDSALYPIITQLERAAGFRRDDTRRATAGQAGGGARQGDRRPQRGRRL